MQCTNHTYIVFVSASDCHLLRTMVVTLISIGQTISFPVCNVGPFVVVSRSCNLTLPYVFLIVNRRLDKIFW